MVATGLAETLNARGGGLRGGLVPAAACGSQNPPRCRVSDTAAIPVIHGREDVNCADTHSTVGSHGLLAHWPRPRRCGCGLPPLCKGDLTYGFDRL